MNGATQAHISTIQQMLLQYGAKPLSFSGKATDFYGIKSIDMNIHWFLIALMWMVTCYL